MTLDSVLERVLTGFERYYDIDLDTPTEPFHAEARFDLVDMNYLLVKSAKVYEQISREYAYFYKTDELTEEVLEEIEEIAWQTGMANVEPVANHRNTDVTLVIIAGKVDPELYTRIKKAKRQKSYMYGFRGYSFYRLIVCDLSNESVINNRRGADLGTTVNNILTK